MATRISSGWVPSMSITFFGPFPAGTSSSSPPAASTAPFSLRARGFRGLRGFPGLRPGLLLSGLTFDGRSFRRTGRFLPDVPFLPRFPRGFAFRRGPGASPPRNPTGLKLSTAPAAAPSAPFPDAVLCADRLGDLENFRRRFGRIFAYGLAPRLFREGSPGLLSGGWRHGSVALLLPARAPFPVPAFLLLFRHPIPPLFLPPPLLSS